MKNGKFTETSFNSSLLERAVEDFMNERHPEFLSSERSAGKHVRNLSDSFTKNRAEMHGYMNDDNLRASYASHYTITNAAKSFTCLNSLSSHFTATPKNILDIGCGLGASSIAASMFFSKRADGSEINFYMLDESKKSLQDAAVLFNKIKSSGDVFHSLNAKADARSLHRSLSKKCDVVFASNVLNEMPEKDSTELCNYVLKEVLSEDGFFIIIEPALREQTRGLMKLRDSIIEAGIGNVISPCLHQEKCPMLIQNERDWCHFYIEWKIPALVEKYDKLSGTNHKFLKMAYLILQKKKSPSTFSKSELMARCVSSNIKTRGKSEIVVCNKCGNLQKIQLLDKYVSENNSDFTSAKRGDTVSLSNSTNLKAEDRFSILDAWQNLN